MCLARDPIGKPQWPQAEPGSQTGKPLTPQAEPGRLENYSTGKPLEPQAEPSSQSETGKPLRAQAEPGRPRMAASEETKARESSPTGPRKSQEVAPIEWPLLPVVGNLAWEVFGNGVSRTAPSVRE